MSVLDALLEAHAPQELTPEQKRRAEENARRRGTKAGAFDYINAARPKDERDKARESEVGVGILLEHFGEHLAPPPAPKAKPSAAKAKPRQPHRHLQGMTDSALRGRLKADSGSSPSERQAAAALLQARKDHSESHAAKQAAKAERSASEDKAKDDAGAGPEAQESRGDGVGILLEAFTAPAPSSAAASPTAVAKMPTVTDPSHPRGAGGKFTYKSNSKKVLAAENAKSRTIGVGSRGELVKSVQRQVGAQQDGVYGPQTKAAIERFQRQHGLQVDGVIGAQTLAALRGNPDAKGVKPGPISVMAAALKRHKATAGRVDRYAGGVLV